ncbi:MAG TPA: LuxR C-terminal-related transcriptional regulator, partial [Acidimicrobiales bacterium]|nr:LuxR C-terminal-related transcriptional regulator [Acidimicrobiales bacterium]
SHTPMQLVVDEIERLTKPRALSVLDSLIAAVPHGSQLVIVGRSRSKLHLSRSRASGDLWEVVSSDLCFDVNEIVEAYQRAGLVISPDEAGLLCTETEGWPAAVGLALMASGVHGRRHLGVEVPHRQIADYLMEEVLNNESETTRQFLIETSVADRVSGPLCAAITGRADAAKVLIDLERRNLFVSPLDDDRQWYRYHRIWHSFLFDELSSSGRDVSLLESLAAEWHEKHGDAGDAFELYCRCDGLERAGGVLMRHYDDYASRGHISSLLSWLQLCKEEDIESDPQLAIPAGWITLLSGDFERASRYVAAAQRLDLDRPSADGASSMRAAMRNLRGALGLGGARQMLADGLSVIESERPERTRWVIGGYRAVGTAQMILGRENDASDAFQEVLVLTENHPQAQHTRLFSLGCLALINFDRSDDDRAEHYVRVGRRESTAFEGGVLGLPLSVAEATFEQHHQTGSTRPALVKAIAATKRARSVPWLQAEMSSRCSALARQSGNRQVARDVLSDGRQACARMDDAEGVVQRLEQQQALLLRGDPLIAVLSPAERKVLEQLRTYRTLKEIGERLFISRTTVKTHVASIYSKLGVTGRGEAVAFLTGDTSLHPDN